MVNGNPNWTYDKNGNMQWTPTKEMCTEELPKVDPLRQGGGYFCVYDANGNRRDDRMRY
jgi:hypothetical protein